MSRQGGLDAGFCGELVADFTDHYNIGVLPHHVPQALFEGQVDLGVYRALRDAVQQILDGVFDRPDAAL